MQVRSGRLQAKSCCLDELHLHVIAKCSAARSSAFLASSLTLFVSPLVSPGVFGKAAVARPVRVAAPSRARLAVW